MIRILSVITPSLIVLLFLSGCAGGSAPKQQAQQPVDRSWHDVSNEKPSVESPPTTVLPESSDDSQPPSPNTSPSEPSAPNTYTGAGNPISNLTLSSADEINEQNAQIILNGIGMMGPGSHHNLSYQAALNGLCNGVSYKRYDRAYTGPEGDGCQGIGLNDRIAPQRSNEAKSMKQYLFEEYNLLKQALQRYGEHPTISRDQTPQLFEGWIQEASTQLTAVTPASRRQQVINSLMTTESGRTHWRNFIPVASQQGAFGFGQFLPRTSTVEYRINHYDPGDNLKGIAIMLNDRMQRNGGDLRGALMYYHGGNNPGESSRRYADGILARIN